jgi:hypothetical protein
MEYPKNQLDALTKALVLSVTAPSEAKSKAALKIAMQLTQGLQPFEVDACKRQAEEILELID